MSLTKKNIAYISGSYFAGYDILQKIKTKYNDAEYYQIDDTVDFGRLYSLLTTDSMFSVAKLLVIHSLCDLTETEKKQLKEILEKTTDNILVVFFMLDNNKYKFLYNFAQANCKIYEFDDEIALTSVAGYIEKRCHELHIEIMQDDMAYLASNLQKTSNGKCILADTIEMTLQKLILFAPNKKTFDKNDILQTATTCQNFIIWDIIAACDSQDFLKCLNSFHDCVQNSYNPIAALNEVINILAWKFRMLFAIKEKMANKQDQKSAIQHVSSIRKIGYDGIGMNAKTKLTINETGQSKGNAAVIWNAGLCQQAVNSFYGKTPQIELYNRKDLYVILDFIEEVMILSRGCEYDGQAYLLVDMLFSVICKNLGNNEITKLKHSLRKMNSYG